MLCYISFLEGSLCSVIVWKNGKKAEGDLWLVFYRFEFDCCAVIIDIELLKLMNGLLWFQVIDQ